MAIILGVLTVMGLAPLFGHDVWLHALEALAAGFVVLATPRRPRVASQATSRA